MLLHSPVFISSRLMPAVKIGNDTISVELSGYTGGRSVFTMWIDFADGTAFEDNSLSSPRESVQEALASYLSFLSDAAESYCYGMRTGQAGDNADLFPAHVTEWAYQHSDELSSLAYDLENDGRVLIDEGQAYGKCCKCNDSFELDYLEDIYDTDTETEADAKPYCRRCKEEVFE